MTPSAFIERWRNLSRTVRILSASSLFSIVLFGLFWVWLPDRLFDAPTSTVLLARDGTLLSARVAQDGQWRHAPSDSVPYRFAACVIEFEDRWFRWHPGFNPVAFVRAMRDNLHSGRKRGGSTLTMQVIRLSRGNPPRTIVQKLSETLMAVRIEMSLSKDSILALYAAHAPMGGNVVGLEAASWRYFGRPAHRLSWAESATLAVLPNAPALIHPGRNRHALLAKRDRLLKRLLDQGIISPEQYDLALMEPIPERPIPQPDLAPHLLLRAVADGQGGRQVRTTIDPAIQMRATATLGRHHRWLSRNEVHNAAALIVDTRTGTVLAYVGNVEDPAHDHGEDVDIISAPRSSGSILKPFLFASAMQDGKLLPGSLVPDIPTDFSGYSPKNFFPVFDGAVAADEALMRSLNIPYVFMLRDVGIERFHGTLQQHGLSTIRKSPGHYGLSLILGGAEVNLWDITRAYAQMGHVLLNDTVPYVQRYISFSGDETHTATDRGAAWLTLEALTALNRPVGEGDWQIFSSSRRVAWKTGTSFGLRDAWAVGVTPDHTIGVWVGNANGEGRPGITGLTAAAPILFDLVGQMGSGGWFSRPDDVLLPMATCSRSGMKAGPYCDALDTTYCHPNGARTQICRFHRQIFTDKDGKRAASDCREPHELIAHPWFVLPPLQEWYYRRHHADHTALPPWAPGCGTSDPMHVMEWVYPRSATSVVIPREMDGTRGKVVFELAHTIPGAVVYWHMDGTYMGRTEGIHKLELAPDPGPHRFTVVDQEGHSLGLSVRVER